MDRAERKKVRERGGTARVKDKVTGNKGGGEMVSDTEAE